MTAPYLLITQPLWDGWLYVQAFQRLQPDAVIRPFTDNGRPLGGRILWASMSLFGAVIGPKLVSILSVFAAALSLYIVIRIRRIFDAPMAFALALVTVATPALPIFIGLAPVQFYIGFAIFYLGFLAFLWSDAVLGIRRTALYILALSTSVASVAIGEATLTLLPLYTIALVALRIRDGRIHSATELVRALIVHAGPSLVGLITLLTTMFLYPPSGGYANNQTFGGFELAAQALASYITVTINKQAALFYSVLSLALVSKFALAVADIRLSSNVILWRSLRWILVLAFLLWGFFSLSEASNFNQFAWRTVFARSGEGIALLILSIGIQPLERRELLARVGLVLLGVLTFTLGALLFALAGRIGGEDWYTRFLLLTGLGVAIFILALLWNEPQKMWPRFGSKAASIAIALAILIGQFQLLSLWSARQIKDNAVMVFFGADDRLTQPGVIWIHDEVSAYGFVRDEEWTSMLHAARGDHSAIAILDGQPERRLDAIEFWIEYHLVTHRTIDTAPNLSCQAELYITPLRDFGQQIGREGIIRLLVNGRASYLNWAEGLLSIDLHLGPGCR